MASGNRRPRSTGAAVAELDPDEGELKRSRPSKDKPIYWIPVGISSPSRLKPNLLDPRDIHSHAVIYHYNLGKKDDLTTAIARENVLQFFYPHVLELGGRERNSKDLDWLKMRRDLFLLAFEAVQKLPSTDKWSFYQIAGIHGIPHVPYDGADEGNWDPINPKRWGGYCQHGSPLFPTWHRPYVMLLEQSIIRQAKLLAETLIKQSEPEEKEAVLDIAEKIRLPYWDWANTTSRILGLPDVFTTTEITLYYNWKSFSRRVIPNPLKAFVLPENVGNPIASSDVFNPAAKPNYVVPSEGTPFMPLGYPTVRHVSPAYTTQNDKLNFSVIRDSQAFLVAGVRAVFHHKDWLSFSNHYWSPATHGDGGEYGHYSSLELVHDFLHDTIGGSGGQMSYPDTAGFDPIFFFHHCNVDRLLALWQYCYPTSWIADKHCPQVSHEGTFTSKPDSPVDSSTDLTPFRRSQFGGAYVSSNDVRTVDLDCGYSYPEIIRARKECWSPSRMLHYVLQLYKPTHRFRHSWFLVLERIPKRAFNGPYKIRVFLDKSDADADPLLLQSPHYAGYVSVFARSNSNRCANCETHQFIRASLDLTKTMLDLGLTTAPEMSFDATPDTASVLNPLEKEGAITLVYVNPTGQQLNPHCVSGWDGPKLTVYYQVGVKDENVYEYLLEADGAATSAVKRDSQLMREHLDQNHRLPKHPDPIRKFELTT